MFIKRNHTILAGKDYQSVLLVQGKRVQAKRPPGGPLPEPPRPNRWSFMKRWPISPSFRRISSNSSTGTANTRRRPLKAPARPPVGPTVPSAIHLGPCYGVLAALDGLARELGLVQAVGEQSRTQRLALFLIYARLAHQGSRLSAVRWSEDHAVKEILQVGGFDEDDLYAALEDLEARQESIEVALAPKAAAQQDAGHLSV